MANVKISELTALTAPDGAEELVINDSGTTKKMAINKLGTPKAWIIFKPSDVADGTLDGVQNSFNISSITEVSTGNYTLHFPAGVMANKDYVVTSTCMGRYGNFYTGLVNYYDTATDKTTTQLKIKTTYLSSGTAYAYTIDSVSILIHGD